MSGDMSMGRIVGVTRLIQHGRKPGASRPNMAEHLHCVTKFCVLGVREQ